MQHRPIVSSAIALLTTIGMLASTGAQAGMYRYEDENGRMVISNTIPQEATKRGYDILGNNGRVVETVPPGPNSRRNCGPGSRKGAQAPGGNPKSERQGITGTLQPSGPGRTGDAP